MRFCVISTTLVRKTAFERHHQVEQVERVSVEGIPRVYSARFPGGKPERKNDDERGATGHARNRGAHAIDRRLLIERFPLEIRDRLDIETHRMFVRRWRAPVSFRSSNFDSTPPCRAHALREIGDAFDCRLN